MDLEQAEASINQLIERQARKGETDPDEADPTYMESVRRYNAARRRANRALWYGYHLDRAESLRRTMSELIARHEAAADRLLEEPGDV